MIMITQGSPITNAHLRNMLVHHKAWEQVTGVIY